MDSSSWRRKPCHLLDICFHPWRPHAPCIFSRLVLEWEWTCFLRLVFLCSCPDLWRLCALSQIQTSSSWRRQLENCEMCTFCLISRFPWLWPCTSWCPSLNFSTILMFQGRQDLGHFRWDYFNLASVHSRSLCCLFPTISPPWSFHTRMFNLYTSSELFIMKAEVSRRRLRKLPAPGRIPGRESSHSD